jgi:hypothetical protein
MSTTFPKLEMEETQMEASSLVKCLRCGGAMIYETFYGLNEEFGGFKCVICGDIIDPLILQNRHLMSTGQEIILSKARA